MADELIRRWAPMPFELRNVGGSVSVEGYASTFSQRYSMGAFDEEVAPGAFTRNLSQAPDVRFLVNHEGTPLARTKSGTLALSEDSTGLHVRADLDLANPAAQTIVSAVRRGDMDSMSFAFRVAKGGDSWNEDFTHRVLKVLTINNGDVSVVTHPANPNTTVGVRALDEQLATAELIVAICEEIRGGQTLSPANFDRLRSAVDALSTAGVAHDQASDHLEAVLEDVGSEGDLQTLSAPVIGLPTSVARARLALAYARRAASA